MLPFLKPKKLADTIIASRNAKGEIKDQFKLSEEMLKVAESLIGAIADKDASRVAAALEQAWAHMEVKENEQE